MQTFARRVSRWWLGQSDARVEQARAEREYYWRWVSHWIAEHSGSAAQYVGSRVQAGERSRSIWQQIQLRAQRGPIDHDLHAGPFSEYPRLAGVAVRKESWHGNVSMADLCGDYPIVIADFDVPGVAYETIEARLRAFGVPDPCWVISTGGGYHAYWFLARPVRQPDLKSISESFASIFGKDYDPGPTLKVSARTPGTVNTKAKYGDPRWVEFIRRRDPVPLEAHAALARESPIVGYETLGTDEPELGVWAGKMPASLQRFFVGPAKLNHSKTCWVGTCSACGRAGTGYAYRLDRRGEYRVACHSTHCDRHTTRNPARMDLGEARRPLESAPVDLEPQLQTTNREAAAPKINAALDWLLDCTEAAGPNVALCAVSPGLGKDHHTILRVRAAADPTQIGPPTNPAAAEQWDLWVRRGRPADEYYRTHKRSLPVVYKHNGAELRRFVEECHQKAPELQVRVEASPMTLHTHFADRGVRCESLTKRPDDSPALRLASQGWSPAAYCANACPYSEGCRAKGGVATFGGELGPVTVRTHSKIPQTTERRAIIDEHYPLNATYVFDVSTLARACNGAAGALSRGSMGQKARAWLETYRPWLEYLHKLISDRQRAGARPSASGYDSRLARLPDPPAPILPAERPSAPLEKLDQDEAPVAWSADWAYAVRAVAAQTDKLQMFWRWDQRRNQWLLVARWATWPGVIQHGKVLLMDGTGHLTTIGTVGRERLADVWELDAADNMQRTWCNYQATRHSLWKDVNYHRVKRRAGGRSSWDAKWDTIEQWLDEALQYQEDRPELPRIKRLVIATYKKLVESVKYIVTERGLAEKYGLSEIAVDHYEAMVGTNQYEKFDALVMLGQPTKGGESERKMFEALVYANGNANIRARAEAALLRQVEQRLRPLDASNSPNMGAHKHVLYVARQRPYHWATPGYEEDGKVSCELLAKGVGRAEGTNLVAEVTDWMELVGACYGETLEIVFGQRPPFFPRNLTFLKNCSYYNKSHFSKMSKIKAKMDLLVKKGVSRRGAIWELPQAIAHAPKVRTQPMRVPTPVAPKRTSARGSKVVYEDSLFHRKDRKQWVHQTKDLSTDKAKRIALETHLAVLQVLQSERKE